MYTGKPSTLAQCQSCRRLATLVSLCSAFVHADDCALTLHLQFLFGYALCPSTATKESPIWWGSGHVDGQPVFVKELKDQDPNWMPEVLNLPFCRSLLVINA